MRIKKIVLILLLNWFSVTVLFAQVDTLIIFSESMNKTIPNLVVKPQQYKSNVTELPVLYLLHGAGGNYTNWLLKVPLIKKYATDFNILIVCPDGGKTSWYFDSPVDDEMKYETYISKELIEFIDQKYNTIAQKEGRAITGLSMGGHGAFYLAFKHQEIWGAAGSMSGGVDIRPFPKSWEIHKRLGSYETHKENWDKNTVINLVHLLKGDLQLIFDCGYNDFFLQVNQNLHEKLVEMKIAHDYIERPGSHNWDYWRNSIEYQLLFFNKFFTK